MSEEGAEDDLSGRWSGFYNYPNDRPPTPFEAELRDHGGRLSGIVTEPGDTRASKGMTLHAVLQGERKGSEVRFAKRYDYLPRAHYAVDYQGRIAPGGDEIEGEWRIVGAWSGTFLMIRGSREGESVARRVSEEV